MYNLHFEDENIPERKKKTMMNMYIRVANVVTDHDDLLTQ